MRNLYPYLVLSLCTVLIPGTSRAQEQKELPVWRVELRGAPAVSVGQYSATLETFQHEKVATAYANSDNNLEFREVPSGDYWITVLDADGTEVYHGNVTVRMNDWPQAIDLDDGGKTAKKPGGLVSVSELKHPPARRAVEAAVEAQKLAEQGKIAEAAKRLEKAIRISPDYAAAHTNLAAQEIRLGRFEDAIVESRRAMALSQPNARDFGNLAYAEFQLNRRAEAIQAAEAGLRIDEQSAKLHYILGTLLALDQSTVRESIPHLELAARTIPGARANLDAVRKELR